MSGGDGRVWWRGVQLDARTAAQMGEVVRLVEPGIPIQPSQGSWSGAAASAGTHSGCGAVDLMNLSASQCGVVVQEMRRVGMAAWHRTPQQSDWPRHVHGISVQPGGKHDRGCLHSSAASQVVDYYEGRNGLASGAPDDGPRTFVGVTWETYQEEDAIMAGTLIVFFMHDHKVYEANLGAGTYYWVPDEAALADRRYVLQANGITAVDWENLRPVANPAAFGRDVTGG